MSGTETGVYVGTFMNDWGEITRRDPDALPMYQPTGSGHSMLAGRLSYFYNLRGPSMTVDTACSASFVALHNACSALRAGDCASALVGGVNSLLNHDFLSTMSSMSFLSADGRSYTYDKRANGYARGEGVACVLLKRLDHAIRDGDTIRAVIRGVALNQDGRTPGITHPSGTQQAALIRRVYEAAGLDPADTSYVETHGTGTQAGDVTEAKALHEAFGTREGRQPLVVGSVKTSIGHLEGASGLAGLVKTVMMLEKEIILPNAGFGEPNEKIKLKEWNMEVPTTARPWPAGSVLRASINNFGYAGTNAHVIVEQAKGYLKALGAKVNYEGAHLEPRSANGHRNGEDSSDVQLINEKNHQHVSNGIANGVQQDFEQPLVFALSANDGTSSKNQAVQLAAYLRKEDTPQDRSFLKRLAATLDGHRSRFPSKTAVSASTTEELATALETAKSQNSPKVPALGFVFNGQGAQWHAMGRELLPIAVFRDSLDRSSSCLASLGADWNVATELSRDADDSRVNEATISQPLCTILQLALVDLLTAWCIKPAAVVGHSSGELAAAYTAGLASRQEVIAAAYLRGLAAVSSNEGHDCPGAMAAIPAAEERVNELISRVRQGSVAIACYNSPSILTVSGDDTAVSELVEICKGEGFNARKLVVNIAYHSSRMATVADGYIEAMAKAAELSSTGETKSGVQQTCEMFSSVTGARCTEGIVLGPQYWADNLTSPVRFTDAVTAMCTETRSKAQKAAAGRKKASIDCVVEIGPHGALAAPLRQIMQSQSQLSTITYLSALTRNHDALETTLNLAARLFEKGYAVDLAAVNGGNNPSGAPLLTNLPAYPWNHETSYWAEPRASKQYRNRRWPRHDLLGAPVNFSNELEPRWRNWARTSELPWLRDHRVNGLMVYPAAGYVAMAIEGARQRAVERGLEVEGYELRDVRIGQALVIPEPVEEVETMMTMRPYAESARGSSTVWDEFTVFSAAEDGSWTENCRGLISSRARTQPNEVNGAALLDAERQWHAENRRDAESVCDSSRTAAEVYSSFAKIGLEYEGTFASVSSTTFGSGRAVGRVVYPDVEACMPMRHHSPFVIHPAFLDSAFQVAFFGVAGEVRNAMVPTFIAKAFVAESITRNAGDELAVYTEVSRAGQRETDISLQIYDDQNDKTKAVVSVTGLTMTSLGGAGDDAGRAVPQGCYTLCWRPDPELLLPEQLASLCHGLRTQGPDDETLRLLDEATFYMAEEALAKVPEERLPSLTEKSQKLYGSFKGLCDKVYTGQMPQDVSMWTKTSAEERAMVWERVRAAGDEGALYLALKTDIHRIILEETDPLSVVMKDDVLGRYYAADVRMSTQCRQAAAYIDLLANKNPRLRVLEIGAGTGGATVPILEALGGKLPNEVPRFASYDITDITTGFFEKLRVKTAPWESLLKYGKLNIEQDPGSQGYEAGSYDVVVASNVLHATEKMDRTLEHVGKLLRPGGKLVLVELMRDIRACTRIFGVFDGWWIGAADRRTDSPLLNEDDWDALLRKTGFTGLDLRVWDLADPEVHQGTTMISSKAETDLVSAISPVVVVGNSDLDNPIARTLGTIFSDYGSVEVQTMQDVQSTRPAVVLAELSTSILKDPTEEELTAIKSILLNRDTVLWITRGATASAANPDLNLVSGLLATLRAETGGSLAHLDLEPGRSEEEAASVIARVYRAVHSATGVQRDLDFAERDGGVVMIRRCEKEDELSQVVSSTLDTLVPETQAFVQPGRPLKLKVDKPGLLDSLYFVEDEAMATAPEGDEVYIEVEASALNFRDVMMVNQYSLCVTYIC